jgi:hypothetical protein
MGVRWRDATAAIVTAGCILLLGSEAGALTIEEYLDRSKSGPESPDGAWLSSYAVGLRDAIYDFNAIMQISGVYVFCPPEEEPAMSAGEFRQRIDATIENYRTQQANFEAFAAGTPVGVIGIQVLTELHACQQDGEEDDGAEAPSTQP